MSDLLVAGLTAAVTELEREAARTPPYPTPSAQRVPRRRLLRELVSRLPPEGDGPLTVTRVRARPGSYRSAVDSLGRPGRFDFGDAACALLAVGSLDDSNLEALVELLPGHCGVRRQQVLNRLAADDLSGARAAAERIADGLSWVGYRDIGGARASRGDADGFFSDWKRYAPGRDRTVMVELKRQLVTGVARNQGWRAALALTEDKRIGPGFARFAFTAFPVGDIDGLSRVFAGDAAGVLSEMDEVSVLAEAVREASGHNPERDHPLLGGIVDRIIAVDPTVDKATMRWRDAQLYYLWPAYGEQATLDRVRAAVRTPQYRRDLKVLARNFPESGSR